MKRLFRVTKRFRGNEAGVALIETMVALVLLSLITFVFVGGMGTASKATIIADEQATAESLAQSQMEYIQNQDYINYADTFHEEYELIATPESYSVGVNVVPINVQTGEPLPSGQDNGIQRIIVIVERNDESIFTIEAYKGHR